AGRPPCRTRSWPMTRSPGTSGVAGHPLIGPVLLKNAMAGRCRTMVRCRGAGEGACAGAPLTLCALARAAATPAAPPASATAARAAVSMRVRLSMEVLLVERRVLLESLIAYDSNY